MKLLLFLLLLFPKEYVGTGYLVSVEKEELEIVKTMDPEKVNEIVESNLNIKFDVEEAMENIESEKKSIEFYVSGELNIYIQEKEVYRKRSKLVYRNK